VESQNDVDPSKQGKKGYGSFAEIMKSIKGIQVQKEGMTAPNTYSISLPLTKYHLIFLHKEALLKAEHCVV
jgi:hypothetical protein